MTLIDKLYSKISVFINEIFRNSKFDEEFDASNDCSTELLALAEKQYYYELDQQNKENNYISIPIGILTILLSAAKFPLENKINYSCSSYSFIFYTMYALFCITALRIIYYIYKHQKGINYARIESVDIINKKMSIHLKTYFNTDEMIAWISEHNPPEEQLKRIKEAEINIFLIKEYSICASKNYNNNNKKNFYYSKIKILLIYAIGFMVLSHIFHYLITQQNNNNNLTPININLLQILR